MRKALPPMTENQTALAPLGTSSTPTTNCRTVRPREIRARNVPTNGAQEIYQAQWKKVHAPIQSGSEKAPVRGAPGRRRRAAVHGARLDAQVEPAERLDTAEGLLEVVDVDCSSHRRRPRST